MDQTVNTTTTWWIIAIEYANQSKQPYLHWSTNTHISSTPQVPTVVLIIIYWFIFVVLTAQCQVFKSGWFLSWEVHGLRTEVQGRKIRMLSWQTNYISLERDLDVVWRYVGAHFTFTVCGRVGGLALMRCCSCSLKSHPAHFVLLSERDWFQFAFVSLVILKTHI